MHRILLALLLSSFSALAADYSWSPPKFAEVRAYAWPTSREARMGDGMKLPVGAINPSGAVLNKQQVHRLLSALGRGHREHPVAMCHNPHNAFVFYDAARKPVGYVEVCFSCFSHQTEPEHPMWPIEILWIASIFDEHKLPLGEYPTFKAYKKHFDEVYKEWEAAK